MHPECECLSTFQESEPLKMINIVDCNLLSLPVFQCNFIDLPQISDVVDVLNAYFKSNDFGPESSLTQTTNTYLEFLIFTGQLNVFLLV